MEKQNQSIQDTFLNQARKERAILTIYLISGVKLAGRIKGFDKYAILFETGNQEQLIYKHAISTVVLPKASGQPMRSQPVATQEDSFSSTARD